MKRSLKTIVSSATLVILSFSILSGWGGIAPVDSVDPPAAEPLCTANGGHCTMSEQCCSGRCYVNKTGQLMCQPKESHSVSTDAEPAGLTECTNDCKGVFRVCQDRCSNNMSCADQCFREYSQCMQKCREGNG